MTEKKITVELTEAEARELVRVGPADDDGRVNVFHARNGIDKIAAALPPEYPEGTVAWVTEIHSSAPEERRYLAVHIDGHWYDGTSQTTIYDASQVEPLRVLADDEIAVRRDALKSPAAVRMLVRHLADCPRYHRIAQDILNAYADALEAEAK